MDTPYIPVLLGTGREGRESEKVANYVHTEVKNYGFETELVDVKDIATPVTSPMWAGEHDRGKRWKEIIDRADGLIIVAPEYNRGYPGELKLALDILYAEYNRKAAGIVAVSNGMFGGARMVEQLRIPLTELQLVVIKSVLSFPNVKEAFNEDGSIKDAKGYGERTKGFLDEFKWYASALKAARSQK